jgi:nicotinamide mononucleotide (NMN) deamidase PncC
MGPGGGTPDKPVGTIWLALAYDGGYQTKLLHLAHDRQTSKEITIAAALNLVRTYLDGLTNEVYQMSASTSRASDPNR